MPNSYIFKTRALGPNAKNSTLTFDELDNSLLFLSSSIGTLNGSNSFFVQANGTPLQNGYSLIDSYNTAKTTTPTGSNRYSVLLGPGNYEFTQSFNINTPYIDVVSLTGYKDVYITGSNTIQVSADNVYVRGIDVGSKNFTITSSLPNTIFKNCKGGDYSFGGSTNNQNSFTISSTFIDCEGGDYSFAGNGSAYGIFTDCIGKNSSFGYTCNGTFTNCTGGSSSFANQGNIEYSTFSNCQGEDYSFASAAQITNNSILKECIGGLDSFANINQNGRSTSTLLDKCTLTSGSWNTSNLVNNSRLIDCIQPTNTLITTTP
jgi:hypothetical protein